MLFKIPYQFLPCNGLRPEFSRTCEWEGDEMYSGLPPDCFICLLILFTLYLERVSVIFALSLCILYDRDVFLRIFFSFAGLKFV
jgi:hypothetical protein